MQEQFQQKHQWRHRSDKPVLDTNKSSETTMPRRETAPEPPKPAPPSDSLSLINQSRNEILGRSASCASPPMGLHRVQLSQVPEPPHGAHHMASRTHLPGSIHITAVDRRKRMHIERVQRGSTNVKSQQPATRVYSEEYGKDVSPTRYIHRSILSGHDLFPKPVPPVSSNKRAKLTRNNTRSNVTAVLNEDEKVAATHSRSFDYPRGVRLGSVDESIEKVTNRARR